MLSYCRAFGSSGSNGMPKMWPFCSMMRHSVASPAITIHNAQHFWREMYGVNRKPQMIFHDFSVVVVIDL